MSGSTIGASSFGEEALRELKPVLDFLNVKYYLSRHRGGPKELSGLQLGGEFDLDVYRSDSVWPRAFFTDALSSYETLREFVGMLKAGDGYPFAAVTRGDVEGTPGLVGFLKDQRARRIVPASDYGLTSNTTWFTVVAPSAGVIVLTEAYLTGDFRVTVNGQAVPYF